MTDIFGTLLVRPGRAALIASYLSLPMAASASETIGDLDCEIVSSCTNLPDDGSLKCSPDPAIMRLRQVGQGEYEFGWLGGATFRAEEHRRDSFSFFEVRERPNSIQTLVIGDDLRGTFSVVAGTPTFGRTAIAHSSLVCTRSDA